MHSRFQIIKKEARMKKIIIVLLALFLALPAISYAGSVTSRWDMTIGGYVGVGMGYSDQSWTSGSATLGSGGADSFLAARSGMRGNQNRDNEYGNFFSTAAETRLNFLIKGPDGGGAKTSAFIEGDFRGGPSGGASQSSEGNFALRHAFLKLDWPNATLTAGQTWQRWGFIPSYAVVGQLYGFNDLGPFQKGQRQPRLDFEQRFGKNFSAAIALVSPNNVWGTIGNSAIDGYSMSKYPFLEGEFKFTTDKCGKIGPYGMMAALGGFYGQEKRVSNYNNIATAGQNSNLYTDRNINSWAISLKGFFPIIPERNKNKAMSLAIGGNLFYGQNFSWFAGPMATMQNTYQRVYTGAAGNAINGVYVAPTSYGGFGQVTFFFTNKLFIDGYYGYLKANHSYAQRYYANPYAVNSQTQAIVNLNYDLNQAVRFGVQYAYTKTVYNNFAYNATVGVNGPATLLDRQGSSNSFRIGAYYFF
ncbi:MAG: hypothetical protein C0392_06305 [Syntrophus sp. (in: bacteria)]|nr:hypothetical protein [Syntrophus sp. (in: bacteria)]